MRVFRSAAALGAVGAVVLAAGASAAGASAAGANTLTINDAKGDANAVNGQGLVPGLGDHGGPAQKADSDIVSLTFAGTGTTRNAKGKRSFACTGFTVTMELAAPPAANTRYRVLGDGTVNSDQFWLEYDAAPTGAATTLRADDTLAQKDVPIAPAKVDGSKITFTVTDADLKRVGEKIASFGLYRPGADVWTSTGQGGAPAWDVIDQDETKSFSPCG